MKYTKEDAHKELVAKMTEKGEKLSISEISINKMLDNLIPMMQTEGMELGEFIEKVLPIFKTSNDNVRNDVSVGIKNYIDKNPKTKQDEPKNDQNPNNQVSDELLERLKRMEDTIAAFNAEKTRNDVKGKLMSMLKEKGVKDEKWIDGLLSEVTIDENTDVDAKAETYLNLYNISRANVSASTTPTSAGSQDDTDTKLEERIKRAAEFAKSQNLIS